MKSALLIYKTIAILIVILIFFSGCIIGEPKPTNYLSNEQLKVTIGESHAWSDFMPGASRTKHISIPVEIENNAGVNLNNLYIYKAEVIKNDKIIGDFRPKFQISRDCSGKLDGEKFVDKINLLNGCKLNFGIRAWRRSDNLQDFEGIIKVRFKFLNNDYYTDIYETNEMTISKVY